MLGGGCGTVFRVDKSGNKTTLYAFTGGANGANPYCDLLLDSAGNLYGTTPGGGIGFNTGFGVVFKLDPAGNETVLHSFSGPPADGEEPVAGVIQDPAGNLYGTTAYGGSFNQGTVFKLDPAGNETVLYSFSGGADGGVPSNGALARDPAGNLYGATVHGGSFNQGTVFKLDPAGHQAVLHNFGGSGDGLTPIAGVTLDAAGSLYGTTCNGGSFGAGTVFKLDNTGAETLLYSLAPATDGACPQYNLILDAAGNLYGTATANGPAGGGTAFKVIP
jgi:uncharacterized repeat protein (TIGR03803 family)